LTGFFLSCEWRGGALSWLVRAEPLAGLLPELRSGDPSTPLRFGRDDSLYLSGGLGGIGFVVFAWASGGSGWAVRLPGFLSFAASLWITSQRFALGVPPLPLRRASLAQGPVGMTFVIFLADVAQGARSCLPAPLVGPTRVRRGLARLLFHRVTAFVSSVFFPRCSCA